jgi:hypothetical protein
MYKIPMIFEGAQRPKKIIGNSHMSLNVIKEEK